MIDQNPKYFEPILDYLRNKKLIIDPNVSMEGVLAEAQFFQIQSLIDLLEEKSKEKDSLTKTEAHLKNISEDINAMIIQAMFMESKLGCGYEIQTNQIRRWIAIRDQINNIAGLKRCLPDEEQFEKILQAINAI